VTKNSRRQDNAFVRTAIYSVENILVGSFDLMQSENLVILLLVSRYR
jgi:hypothetical protein